jgi:hypothetical protein
LIDPVARGLDSRPSRQSVRLLAEGCSSRHGVSSTEHLSMLGRLGDGTPHYSPLGKLVVDVDEDRVQCHLCGRWFAQLGSVHLPRAHGVSAERYRELIGLRPGRPLWAPGRRTAQAVRYRTGLANNERLRAGMRKGAALARSGELSTRRTGAVQRAAGLARARTSAATVRFRAWLAALRAI